MTALLGLATRLGLARLMLITGTRSGQGDLAEFVDAAFAGGVDAVQVRDPQTTQPELLAALNAVRSVGYRYQGLVCAYESGPLAQEFQADLLHLPERGMGARLARGFLHKWALIGRSCHSRAEIDAALADADVNYLTIGPAFGGLGGSSAGLSLVRYAASVAPTGDRESKPWFAVGGVTAANLDEVLAAGARRVAVTRAITEAADAEAAAMAMKDRLRQAWNEDPEMQGLTLKVFRD